jgi:hypothetical protein
VTFFHVARGALLPLIPPPILQTILSILIYLIKNFNGDLD